LLTCGSIANNPPSCTIDYNISRAMWRTRVGFFSTSSWFA
jgi:hypothetical protein